MTVKAKTVIGLPVYTIKEGTKIDNTVQDVVFDPHTNKVEGLVLDEGGWFSDTKIILTRDIHSIGSDAVLIENEDKISTASDVNSKVASIAEGDNYLTADKVITEQGEELGRISDLIFDAESGMVEAFEVNQGALQTVGTGKKIFKTQDIITVGNDAIIVREYVNAEFEKQAQEQGVTGSVNRARNEAPSILDNAKKKTQELTQKAREKIEETRDSQKTQDMVQQAKDKAGEVKRKSEHKIKQEQKVSQERKEADVVGQYVTRNIVSQDDKILAKRGDMVTHKLLEQAKKNKVFEQVLNNTTNEPLSAQEVPNSQTQRRPEGLSFSEPDLEAVVIESVEETFPENIPVQTRSTYGALGGVAERTQKDKKKRKR